MFSFFKNVLKNDFVVLAQDFTRHIGYTIFIVIFSSLITYLIVGRMINLEVRALIPAFNARSNPVVALQAPKEELYVERGSAYDNRTIGTESANVIFHGPRDKKKIALTFDAEMTDSMKANVISGRVKSSYDRRITDILTQTNTKATLFLTGMWIELYPKETRELSDNPLFELGSHSYADTSYHGYCYGLKQIPSTLAIEEIGSTEKLLREHAGIDNRLFRFPGGCYTPDDVKLVNLANDDVVHWDISGADGFNNNTAQIVKNIVDNTQNGSIIILHMNGAPTAPKTAEALPQIITKLKAKGFEFVKVNELLGFPPETRSR